MLTLYLVTLSSSLSSSGFLVASLAFSVNNIVSSADSHSFTFSCLIWISVLSFSCVITLAGSSNTMFNKRGESRHPCLVSDLRGNAFSFSLLSMMLAGYGFVIYDLYYDVCSLYTHFVESFFFFIKNEC